MKRLGFVASVIAVTLAGMAHADVQLNAAVLPTLRTTNEGQPVTFFATVINSGDTEATNCRVEADPDNSLGTDMDYRRTDAANLPIGTENTPFSIPASGSQSLVLTVRPQGTAAGGNYLFRYVCDEASLDSTQLLSGAIIRSIAAGEDYSDMIMILQTLSHDGIIRFAENGRRGVAAGAVINNGTESFGGDLDLGFPGLSLFRYWPSANHYRGLLICQTDASATCLAPPEESLRISPAMEPGEIITFNVYFDDSEDGEVPLIPEFLRLVVHAEAQFGLGDDVGVAGATSVAVFEPDGPVLPADAPASGQWYGYYGNSSDFGLQRVQVTLSQDGSFVMRTPLFAARFPDNDYDSSRTVYGTASVSRDGLVLRPTGTMTRIDNRTQRDSATIDALVLEVGSRMSGRPDALNGERARGYYNRPFPVEQLLPYYSTYVPLGSSVPDNRLNVRGLTELPFRISGALFLDSDRQTLTSSGLNFGDGVMVGDSCPASLSLIARGAAPGEAAPQTFDATLTVDECTGNAELELTGEYTGWAMAEDWLTYDNIPNGPALCSLLVFVERGDGTELPFWIQRQVPTSSGTYPCNQQQ